MSVANSWMKLTIMYNSEYSFSPEFVTVSECYSTILSMRFPQKLWKIVNECNNGAIQWNCDGTTILIDYTKFQKEYLDNRISIFKTNNITSFIRQLNLYGFKKVSNNYRDTFNQMKNTDIHEFRNVFFVKGRYDLLTRVSRKTTNSNNLKQPVGLTLGLELTSFRLVLQRQKQTTGLTPVSETPSRIAKSQMAFQEALNRQRNKLKERKPQKRRRPKSSEVLLKSNYQLKKEFLPWTSAVPCNTNYTLQKVAENTISSRNKNIDTNSKEWPRTHYKINPENNIYKKVNYGASDVLLSQYAVETPTFSGNSCENLNVESNSALDFIYSPQYSQMECSSTLEETLTLDTVFSRIEKEVSSDNMYESSDLLSSSSNVGLENFTQMNPETETKILMENPPVPIQQHNLSIEREKGQRQKENVKNSYNCVTLLENEETVLGKQAKFIKNFEKPGILNNHNMVSSVMCSESENHNCSSLLHNNKEALKPNTKKKSNEKCMRNIAYTHTLFPHDSKKNYTSSKKIPTIPRKLRNIWQSCHDNSLQACRAPLRNNQEINKSHLNCQSYSKECTNPTSNKISPLLHDKVEGIIYNNSSSLKYSKSNCSQQSQPWNLKCE